MPRLPREFYARDTIDVARDLIGQVLTRRFDDGETRAGLIVETEAYLGPEDPAAHSFGARRTPRVEPMYGAPGTAYVYFIYGVHHCLNVVTVAPGVPEAVLVRALEPTRGWPDRDPARLRGPGKLCRALAIDLSFNRLDLTEDGPLAIERGEIVSDAELVSGPRVGLGERHDAVHWPLRFGLKRSPALSRPRFPDAT